MKGGLSPAMCRLKSDVNMIGILSDAHGNYYAFERAINIFREIGVDKIIFLGDAVGYIPSVRVVEYLMSATDCTVCLRGNHEDMLLRGDFDERDEVYKLRKTLSLMNEACFNFIVSWPTSYSFEVETGTVFCVHGSPNSHTFGYVYPDSDLSVFTEDAKFIFMGNSHHPFVKSFRNTIYINVGSCGLPRDDGRYGSLAVFDAKAGQVKILRFDIRQLSEKTISTEKLDIHNDVKSVFSRTKKDLFGEIYAR